MLQRRRNQSGSVEVTGERTTSTSSLASGLVMVPMSVIGRLGGRAGFSMKRMAPVWTRTGGMFNWRSKMGCGSGA